MKMEDSIKGNKQAEPGFDSSKALTENNILGNAMPGTAEEEPSNDATSKGISRFAVGVQDRFLTTYEYIYARLPCS